MRNSTCVTAAGLALAMVVTGLCTAAAAEGVQPGAKSAGAEKAAALRDEVEKARADAKAAAEKVAIEATAADKEDARKAAESSAAAADASAKQAEAIIAQLGVKEQAKRDDAQKNLLALARVTDLEALLKKQADAADPEVRMRVRKVFQDAEWGEPVGGIQLRLLSNGSGWTTEWPPPLLDLDVVNNGTTSISPPDPAYFHVEVDGRWYGPSELPPISDRPVRPFNPGAKVEMTLTLDTKWTLYRGVKSADEITDLPNPAGPRMALAPGKHTVRVSFRIPGVAPNPVAISNPVEIEILSADAKPAAATAPTSPAATATDARPAAPKAP